MSISSEEHEFWDEIILNDDGSVDLEAVYAELHDYRFLMGEAVRVYWDITCGQMSKPNYYAADIIAVADECVQKQIREEVVSVLLDIEDGTMTVEEALIEYTDVVQEDGNDSGG